jgi:hypothetical protein
VRVCIIGGSNLRWMPYFRYYEDVLKELNISFDVLYRNRGRFDEEQDNAFGFYWPDRPSFASRAWGYLAYRRFLVEHLNSVDYDGFIILGVQLGATLSTFLRRHPFILDVRDRTYENFWGYRQLAQDLIRRSDLTCISSEGFRTWLPRDKDYVMSPNTCLKKPSPSITPFDVSKCVVSYIGLVGYYEANVKFLDLVKNMPSISVRYVGADACSGKIERYCRRNGILNATFHGPFTPEEKLKFYEETNFTLGYWGNQNLQVRTLIPNRLYESCAYKRPIIVSQGTYLAQVVAQNGLGIVVQSDIPDELWLRMREYYEPDLYSAYVSNCEKYLAAVSKEIIAFQHAVSEVLRSWGSS